MSIYIVRLDSFIWPAEWKIILIVGVWTIVDILSRETDTIFLYVFIHAEIYTVASGKTIT